MKRMALTLVFFSCVASTARAEEGCASILTGKQVEALRNANHFGNSYEILTRDFFGRTKAVVLVGEKVHQEALGHSVGSSLYKAFDRTAFSFRRKMDLDDKLFGRLAAPVMTALLKVMGYFDPAERKEMNELVPHVQAYLKNPKPVVEIDPALKPFTERNSLVNDAFYEVHRDKVLALARMDIQEFLDEVRADESGVRTVNLEREFRPNWADRLRSKMFSLNAATFALVSTSPLVFSESVTTPLTVGWLAAFTWQVVGISTHGYNARPWFRYAFPFIYVGDGRRNETAVLNILSTVSSKAVNAMAVVVEERRKPDLRERLIRLGFTSVESKPLDVRWMYRK